MAPNSLVSNNYYDKHIAPVRNMSLPAKIKCSRCEYVKPNSSFSKVKLGDLQLHMHKSRNFDAAKTTYVPCINCTGGQKVETKCGDCGKWKGKDQFNKTQWKKDDEEAVCEVCNEGEMRRAYEPPTSDDDRHGEDEDDESDDEFTLSDDGDGVGLGGGLSLTGGSSTYAGTSIGGVPITSTNLSSVGSFNGSTTINGSRKVGSSSTAPSTTGGNSSKWAKAPSGKSKPFKKAEATVDNDERQLADHSSDDESD